jgi:hypothetical protein
VPKTVTQGSDPLFPISVKGKSGYINARGEVVIQPEHWSAYEFYGDRAVVWRLEEPHDFEFAVIDREGRVLTPYFRAEPFDHTYSEGLIPFHGEGGVGFLDLDGSVAVQPQFYFPPLEETEHDCGCAFEGGPVDGFHDGLALVHEGHAVYYIDRRGRRAFDLKIEAGGAFNEGLAPVQVNGKWGLVDKTGRLAVAAEYADVGEYSDGLAPVSRDGETYFFVDAQGNRAFEGDYSFAYPFSEGLAAVALTPGTIQYSYIDTSGRVAFTLPTGASPGQFSEGLVRVDLMKPVVEQTGSNSTREYSVRQAVYYDRAGNAVIRLEPSGMGHEFGQVGEDFKNGLALVYSQDKDKKKGYIDKSGTWVWSTYEWN